MLEGKKKICFFKMAYRIIDSIYCRKTYCKIKNAFHTWMVDSRYDTGTARCWSYDAGSYGFNMVQADYYLDAMCFWTDARH